jgi:formate-dependent nitrite reductase cytochrome c552 subunit
LFVDIEKLCRSSIYIEDEKLWQDSKVKTYILSYFNNCSQCHSLSVDITRKQMLSYDTNNFSIKIKDVHKKTEYYSKDNLEAISSLENMSKEEMERIKNFLQYIEKKSKNKY